MNADTPRLAENSHLLKPPINNYCVYNEDFTVMVRERHAGQDNWRVPGKATARHMLTTQIVGGPNARTDYHINETPEWFYQYKGAMMLKVVDDGEFRDVIIREGDMFLLPANTPHNPVRFADTVGVVLEQRRPPASVDRMRWYCGKTGCRAIVHEAAFHCTDLGTQIKAAVEAFRSSDADRTCGKCGTIADWAPPPRSIPDPNKA